MAKKYDDLKRKQKKERFENWKFEMKSKFKKCLKWASENKELTIIITSAVIGGTRFVVKNVGKQINVKRQEDVKNLYCYDRSLGHYWKLRRELTNDEWIYIDKRKRSGEKLADILDELKVLK